MARAVRAEYAGTLCRATVQGCPNGWGSTAGLSIASIVGLVVSFRAVGPFQPKGMENGDRDPLPLDYRKVHCFDGDRDVAGAKPMPLWLPAPPERSRPRQARGGSGRNRIVLV
jgi:hypothetical protein